MDIEAAGGAATAGLIGGAVERPTGHAGEAHDACTDCGAPVDGNFCANCGQPTHVHRSLLHLIEEVLHGVMHFDGRIWRTLPLLILNPGRLTREWVQGRRTRYVSPLAMFLFTVFLMFFALSFGAGAGMVQSAPLDQRIAAARTAIAEIGADLTLAEADPEAATAVPALRETLAQAQGQLRALEQAQAAGPRADGLAPGSWQSYVADAAHSDQLTIRIGDAKMQDKIRHKLANPDYAVYKIQQTAYKFAFLLVPLSIPFIWLMFAWKRGFSLYDHGVFVLYSLTFMAMLTMVIMGLGRMNGWFFNLVVTILSLAVPVHMFAQLKGAYGLSIFSATWRTLLLLMFCTLVISLFVTAIVVLGLTG